MCMTFGCNPQINVCHFFRSLNLVIFLAYSIWTLVNATPSTSLPEFFVTFQKFLSRSENMQEVSL